MLRPLLDSVIDLIAPRLCHGCRAPLSAVSERPAQDAVRAALRPALCPRCRAALLTIGDGACQGCGRGRSAFEPARGARCSRCLLEPRGGVTTTVAAFRYRGVGRDLLRTLKYSGRRDLASPLGTGIAARFSASHPDVVGACAVALVTAVPLHWSRWLRRGYNHAALVGQAVATELGVPFEPRALRRVRRTRALYGILRRAREAELAGALWADPAIVRDRWVIVVDDIRTTGATLAACGEALLAAGAARVDAAVLGR